MLKKVVRALVLLGLLLATAAPAVAAGPSDGSVNPCAVRDICIIVVEPGGGGDGGTGSGGTSGGTGGTQVCSWHGHQWPCWDDDLGWFSNATGCYYHRSQPQPPAGATAWGGHDPSEGAVYDTTCATPAGRLIGQDPEFFAQPPGGGPPPDNPYNLGMEALGKIHFDSPTLHAAPSGTAVVGVPVWLWYDRSDTTEGPQTAVAKGRTMRVTATARLTKVLWDTDDGTGGETCTDPGTPYRPGTGASVRPACGHNFTGTSAGRPKDSFYLTATLIWRVEAVRSDTGARVFTVDYRVTTDVPLALRVAEVQALN